MKKAHSENINSFTILTGHAIYLTQFMGFVWDRTVWTEAILSISSGWMFNILIFVQIWLFPNSFSNNMLNVCFMWYSVEPKWKFYKTSSFLFTVFLTLLFCRYNFWFYVFFPRASFFSSASLLFFLVRICLNKTPNKNNNNMMEGSDMFYKDLLNFQTKMRG